jgi:hypothetical protein
MMGVADRLERAADLYDIGLVWSLATALATTGPGGREFADVRHAFLATVKAKTLADYLARRKRSRDEIVDDLRMAAAVARGEVRP